MVKSFGESKYAEDLVQETYLRIHASKSQDKVINNGEPNRAFMYVTLRNSYITLMREVSKGRKVSVEKVAEIKSIEPETTKYQANEVLNQLADAEISKWHWYDRELFLHYVSSGKSMRALSSETGISLSSIANTIKNCKAKIREAISEDWGDYLNKDYDKL